jgi:acid phosphatase type 7
VAHALGSRVSRHPSRGVALRLYAAAAALAALALSLGVGAGVPATADSYRNAVLADAPAGYWRLGETSGTTAADATANASAGTYVNGVVLGVPSALPADSNTAARFDGGNDLVLVGDPASGVLDFGTGDFSVEAWLTTTTNNESAIFGKKSLEPHWQVTVTDDPGHVGQIRTTFNDGTTSRHAYSTMRVDDGAWHHLVVVYDRDTATRVYVDGVSAGSAAFAMPTSISNTAPFQIGKTSGYAHFKGDIDEVALYPAALSPERIYAHYAASGRDQTPPAVTLTAPANGSLTNDSTPTFAGIASTAVGDSATVTVEIFAGGGTGGTPVQTLTATRAADGSYAVDASPALGDGTYTAQARQADSGDNTGVSSANTFTIDPGASPPPPPPTPDPVLVGAGDIADCGTGVDDDATANILDGLPAATVMTLGDNAYPDGTPAEFQCYHETWGRHKARTRPSVGGHEYATPGASGYFDYFGAAAGNRGEGWYSYDLGEWHVIVLNTWCAEFSSTCGPGTPQYAWLLADLAAHQTACTIAYWHIGLFSSGKVHGSNARVRPLWEALYEYGVEAVVNGNEHVYERFLPQTPSGVLDPSYGITQFTVGVGGYMFYDFAQILPNSAARNNTAFGVLKLTLHPGSYDWEFLPIAGRTYTDSGTASCHGAPGTPPVDTTPPNVALTSPAGGSSTSDATPTFAGSAGTAPGDEPNITVKVYSGGAATGTPLQTLTATRAADGSYSVEAAAALGLGTYTAQAEQADAAGNTGRSAAATFAVVEADPPLVTLTEPADGSSTTDTTPTFAGTAGTAPGDEASVSVKVYAGTGASGTPLQTLAATPAADGSFAVDAASALAGGTYTAQAEQSDAAGNTGRSAPATFSVLDTTAPVVTLDAPAEGSATTDLTPTFAGTAGTASGDAPSVTVKIYAGNIAVGAPVRTLSATPAPGGSFAMDAAPPLPLGTYTAQAEQNDAVGNTGYSATRTFTVLAYQQIVMSDAPRAYWRLGETSGTTAADVTLTAAGAYESSVVLGVPGAIVGNTNTAVGFDSNKDRVSMGDPASGALDFGTGDFSVEAWIRTTSAAGRVVVGKRTSGPGWSIAVSGTSGHHGEVAATIADGAVTRLAYGPTKRVDDGAWHHVVVAADRDTGITVYVDGVSRATAGATTGSISNLVNFEVGRVSNFGVYRGDVDELALYPSLLSSTRVQAHYGAGRGA